MVEGWIYEPDLETMDRDELRELQGEKLRKTVQYCYDRVPLYKKKFEEAGISPKDIRSVEDLTKIPFTQKNDLREAWPYGMLGTELSDVLSLHCSSGTTGKPTLAPYTKNDLDIWGRSVARCLTMMGVEKGHVFQNAYGYGLFTGGLGLHYGCLELGAAVIPMSGGQTGRQIELAVDLGSDYISCTPSFAARMGEYVREETDFEPEDIPWKAGTLGAEPCTDALRRKIEESLDLEYFDIYGLSEIIGPGVAHECDEHEGLHFHEDFWIPEIVDPDTGEPVAEGEQGELVLTTLGKEASPMLRFRTGDITSIISEECGCGRTGVRTGPEGFVSRTDDMVKVKGAKFWPSTIEDAIVSVEGSSENYRAIIDRPKEVDQLTVEVEPSRDAYEGAGGDISALGDLRRRISESIKNKTSVSGKVELVTPGTFERFVGKGHSEKVIDEREVGAYE